MLRRVDRRVRKIKKRSMGKVTGLNTEENCEEES
jgi:hypothetical protein